MDMVNSSPRRIEAELLGSPGETMHLCWVCPECGRGYSEDYEVGDEPPMPSECGHRVGHQDRDVIEVLLYWQRPQTDRLTSR